MRQKSQNVSYICTAKQSMCRENRPAIYNNYSNLLRIVGGKGDIGARRAFPLSPRFSQPGPPSQGSRVCRPRGRQRIGCRKQLI